MDPSTMISAAGVAAVAWLVGKYGMKLNQRKDDRHMAAIAVAGILREKGLTAVPKALEFYGAGDYSGFASSLRSLAGIMTNPKTIEAEFDNVFDKTLMVKLQNPETRKQLQDRINSVMGGANIV